MREFSAARGARRGEPGGLYGRPKARVELCGGLGEARREARGTPGDLYDRPKSRVKFAEAWGVVSTDVMVFAARGLREALEPWQCPAAGAAGALWNRGDAFWGLEACKRPHGIQGIRGTHGIGFLALCLVRDGEADSDAEADRGTRSLFAPVPGLLYLVESHRRRWNRSLFAPVGLLYSVDSS